MHICMVTIACGFVILLIFVCTFFFLSFLRAQPTNSVFLSSSSFSSDAHKQTHPHPHTNTPTHKQTHMDKPTERQIGARGSWSELVGLDQCLIGARGSWSVLDWSSSWLVLVERSELVDLLLERSLTEMGLAWSELGRSEREGELICVGIEMDRRWDLLEIGKERATNQKIGKERERERYIVVVERNNK